jgi:hypothetical protein
MVGQKQLHWRVSISVATGQHHQWQHIEGAPPPGSCTVLLPTSCMWCYCGLVCDI